MLSVFIDCGPDDHSLAATLASLVTGAVEGLVREVVLVDRGMGHDARKVADHAGCRTVGPETMRTAIGEAKGEWLLLLEPGARLSTGWVAAVAEHLQDAALAHGRVRAARFARGSTGRRGIFGRFTHRRTALCEGMLMTRAQAVGRAGEAKTLEAIAKGLAVTTLDASIRPAGN